MISKPLLNIKLIQNFQKFFLDIYVYQRGGVVSNLGYHTPTNYFLRIFIIVFFVENCYLRGKNLLLEKTSDKVIGQTD